jgi:hypothetical protein
MRKEMELTIMQKNESSPSKGVMKCDMLQKSAKPKSLKKTKTLKFWKTTANLRPIKFMESIIIQFWG